MSVPLILGPDVHTLDEDLVSDEDHVTPYYSFNPVDHPFLAELELVDDNIETIPSTSFTQNQDLYYLSLRQNPIQYIEFGAFANLTNLRVLDIRETTIPSTDAIRKALQEIPSLDKVYADSFAFCCMLDLHPADASDSSGCIAPIDQFSSCDDLLKENTLRVAMAIPGISALAVTSALLVSEYSSEVGLVHTNQAKLITHLAVSDLLMGVYMLIIAIADQYYMGFTQSMQIGGG
nr:G-protein coupled receptor GRL101-like [Lytechinus pictus]